MGKKQIWSPTEDELKFIDRCRSAGYNHTVVAKKLKDEFGIATTPSTVCRKIQKYADKLVNKPKPQFPPEYYFILRYEKKIPVAEIAILTQRSPDTIKYHLSKPEFQEKYAAYKAYSDNKSTSWEYKQARMMQQLNDDLIETMSPKELVDAAVKMEAPIRVMRGEATEFIGLAGLDKEIAALDEEEAVLRKAIDITPVKVEEFENEDELLLLEREIKKLENR